ncbi:MAG: hypothetical protein AAF376_00020 [Pseudomonadota bacterium]
MALGFPEKRMMSLQDFRSDRQVSWDEPKHPLLHAMAAASLKHSIYGYSTAGTPANKDEVPSQEELAPE